MLNPLLQNHPVLIPLASLVIIWDFRLRPPARRGHRAYAPEGFWIREIALRGLGAKTPASRRLRTIN
jgi:hypothetical protein